MASENAKAVAKEVITKVRKGEKINLQEIQQAHGYSKNSAKSMKGVDNDTYRKEVKPLADGIDREIERIKLELSTRDISEEKYKELVSSLDILIKNHQLLNGKETERTGITFNVTKYEEGDNDTISLPS
jgi:hypothetical protein